MLTWNELLISISYCFIGVKVLKNLLDWLTKKEHYCPAIRVEEKNL